MDTDGNPGGPSSSRSRDGKSLSGWPAQSILRGRGDGRGPSLFTEDEQPYEQPLNGHDPDPVAVIGGLADAVANDGPVSGRVSILQDDVNRNELINDDAVDESPPLTWDRPDDAPNRIEFDEPATVRPLLSREAHDPILDQGSVSIMENRAVDPVAGLSTGQLHFRPRRLPLFGLAQLGILIGAAFVVGALVYLGVTSTVGRTSDDEAQGDLEPDPTAIEPGPGDASGPLGSKRTTVEGEMADSVTADDGQGPADDALAGRPQAPADDAGSNPAGGDDGSDAASQGDPSSAAPPLSATGEESTGAGGGGAAGSPSSDDPTSSGPPPTASPPTTPAPTNPPTTQAPTTQTTTGPSIATSPTNPPTTATQPPPTETPPTEPPPTEPPPPTQITIANVPLIHAPADGAVVAWESPLEVELNAIPGAVRYCVALESRGNARRCSAEPAVQFPGGRRQIGPGPAVIVATALDGDGAVLREEKVQFSIRAGEVISEPVEEAEVAVDRRIRLVANAIPAVDEYCWRFVQGTRTTDAFCGPRRTLVISRDESAEKFAGFEPGEATLWVVASRGDDVVGQDKRPIVLTGDFDDLDLDLGDDNNLGPMVVQGLAELGVEGADLDAVDDAVDDAEGGTPFGVLGMVSEMLGDSDDQSRGSGIKPSTGVGSNP